MRHDQLTQKMRPILLRRRDALRRSISGELSRLNTSDERVVGDSADYAVDEDYGLINSHLAELESRELSRIEYALERMRRGDYGQCEECGRRIALARLEALPYATTCVKCQKLGEMSHPVRQLVEHWSRVADDRENDLKPPRGIMLAV